MQFLVSNTMDQYPWIAFPHGIPGLGDGKV